MSIRDLDRRHLKLIGLYSTRYAVRGGAGLIFVILVLLAGLFIAQYVVQNTVDAVERETAKMGGTKEDAKRNFDLVISNAEPIIAWALGESDEMLARPGQAKKDNPWAAYLLREKPALLSAILLVLLWVTPWLCAVGAFNQYSGDVGSRGIRYQLLRAERANIFFGRYIGTALFATLTLGLLIFTITIGLGLFLDYYAWGELLAWGLRGWFAATMIILPYTAVCAWISGAIDSPFGSLVLCVLTVLAPPIISALGGMQTEHARHVKWLLPWAFQNHLLHHSIGMVALAALGCLAYAAVFLAVGYRHFAKRDL